MKIVANIFRAADLPADVDVTHQPASHPVPLLASCKKYHGSPSGQIHFHNRKAPPESWVFNDFGYNSCYFFHMVDSHWKHRQTGNAYRHSQPDTKDEMQNLRQSPAIRIDAKTNIHLNTKDMDAMIKKGYIKPNQKVIVHNPGRPAPTVVPAKNTKPPYELHYYPHNRLIYVVGIR